MRAFWQTLVRILDIAKLGHQMKIIKSVRSLRTDQGFKLETRVLASHTGQDSILGIFLVTTRVPTFGSCDNIMIDDAIFIMKVYP